MMKYYLFGGAALLMGCKVESAAKPVTFDMVAISAGVAVVESRGCDERDRNQDERTELRAFAIDKYPITCDQYDACVAAGGCPELAPEGYCFEAGAPNGGSMHFVQSSRGRAENFCRWRNMHLATAAQWQRAIRGDDGALYPSGETRGELKCKDAVYHPTGRACVYLSPHGAVYHVDGMSEYVRSRSCPQSASQINEHAYPTLLLGQSLRASVMDGPSERRKFRCVRE